MPETDRNRLIALARRHGILSARRVREAGIHSQQLTRLVDGGILERVAAGQYRLVGAATSEHRDFAVVAAAAPRGVICLLSALSFHVIGTQLPADVWLAIERGSHAPALRHPPLRVCRFSGAAFHEGVESHDIDGQTVRIYGVAKTLADLFKFRNRVGLDVAIEALKEAWRDRRFRMDALEGAARACRVQRVMRPYVEAVVG